jgi:hypothetical protein
MPPKNSNSTAGPKAMPESAVETESPSGNKPEQSRQHAAAPAAPAQRNNVTARKTAPAPDPSITVIQKPAKKLKSVRDSYTVSEAEYAELNGLKQRCLVAGLKVKKSELLRAGLRLLQALPSTELNTAVTAVQLVKLNRAKSKKESRKRARH